MSKVMVVTYYFPPLNSIASKRWAEMLPVISTKYDICVFTSNSEGDLQHSIDESKVYRVGHSKELQFERKAQRRNFLHRMVGMVTHKMRTIDVTIFTWFIRNWKEFKKYFDSQKPDILITSIGPFSSALFGFFAKLINKNLIWIVDIRDSVSIYNKNDKIIMIRKLDELLDKFIISRANHLITVSKTLSSVLAGFYIKEIDVIFNGFSNHKMKNKPIRKKVNLYYAGRIYKHQEKSFFLLINTIKNLKINFYLNLLCVPEQRQRYLAYIRDCNADNIYIDPPIENEKVCNLMISSDILIILEDLEKKSVVSKGTLTGKLFDYLSCRKPIMAICRDDSEIGEILDESNCGRIVTDKESILEFLSDYNQYSSNENYRMYSRVNQGRATIKLLDAYLGDYGA